MIFWHLDLVEEDFAEDACSAQILPAWEESTSNRTNKHPNTDLRNCYVQ
jgi:hypothetical protein